MRSFTSLKLSERDAVITLNAINGFGIKRIRQLIERFGSASEALRAPAHALIEYPGLPQASRINLQTFSVDDFLCREHAACTKFCVTVLTFLDKGYPSVLHTISDPPAVLYVAGRLPQHLDFSVAIVGPRRPSLYGLNMAEKFSRELAELGLPVISGLARGVDAAAHWGSLRAGGETLAVVGCGLDIVYPSENRALYDEIRAKGCIISEFPFGMPPLSVNFPRRNRIVSGLSLGVVVVEAGIKSGALLTAGFALEQGREVFAVPGRVDNLLSEGPHALIKQGAKLVLCVEDILEELPLEALKPVQEKLQKRNTVLSGDDRTVFELIKEGHTAYEVLEIKSGFGVTMLTAALLRLELMGKIVQKPGRTYAFKSSVF